jgi:hypothetical protein
MVKRLSGALRLAERALWLFRSGYPARETASRSESVSDRTAGICLPIVAQTMISIECRLKSKNYYLMLLPGGIRADDSPSRAQEMV